MDKRKQKKINCETKRNRNWPQEERFCWRALRLQKTNKSTTVCYFHFFLSLSSFFPMFGIILEWRELKKRTVFHGTAQLRRILFIWFLRYKSNGGNMETLCAALFSSQKNKSIKLSMQRKWRNIVLGLSRWQAKNRIP